MPRRPTTPAQVSGHRFLVRRVEHALVRADAKMLHDPLRTRGRAVAAALVLVALVAAGSVVLGLVRPGEGAVADHEVIATPGGDLHVLINGRLHPVANLASARLALGRPAVAHEVGAGALSGQRLGAPIGIPGAPPVAAEKPAPTPRAAGVCEHVAANPADPAGGLRVTETLVRLGDHRVLDDATAYLAHGDGAHWLVTGGRRARIDISDPLLARAVGLGSAPVRPVGPAWLRAIPQVPDVAAPHVGEVGAPTGFPVPFDAVGRVVDAGDRTVAVTAAGAVDVGPVVAEVLAGLGGRETADEQALARVPVAPSIDRGSLPEQPPRWAAAEGWVCADSAADGAVGVSAGEPDGEAVPYATADGPGAGIDGYLGPAVTVGVNGGEAALLVSAAGLRHTVAGDPGVLGHAAPGRLPWRILASLPEGPQLTKEAALAGR